MVYYAPAIAMSLIMAYFFSTEYELHNGVKVRLLRTFKIVFLVSVYSLRCVLLLRKLCFEQRLNFSALTGISDIP